VKGEKREGKVGSGNKRVAKSKKKKKKEKKKK
jgi:hypothetical protein